ncbi:MAG: 3-dehydroquinate dehydratase II, partial [uncultured Blastococcus sp.]
DDPGVQRREPRPARPPGAGDVRHDHPRRAGRAGAGHRPRDGRRGAGPPDRRRGRDAALDPCGLRRRRSGAHQPRRVVAHLGRAAGRPRRPDRPAGRGAHHQHPRPGGVPAPLLRLRGGRRGDRRPRRERLHPRVGLARAAGCDV